MNEKTTKAELIAKLASANQRIAELETAHFKEEERFASVFRASPSQMALTDALTGKYVEVNEAFLKTLDFTYDEVIGKTALELDLFYNPDQRAELLQRMAAQGYLRNEHILVHSKSGEIRHGIFSAEYVHANGQKLLLTVMNDITEKLQAEQRWQFALEGAGDGVWDWNTQTNQVFFSHQWKSMLGYEEHEIGNTVEEWTSRVHPDDLAAITEKVNAHLEGRTLTYSSEHRVRCKDGSYKWILDRGKVIEWTQNHKPLRVIGTHKDISERKMADERLRESEERFSRIFHSNPASQLIISMENGGVLDVNASFCQQTGFTRTEIIDHTVSELDLWVDPNQRQKLLQQLQHGGEAHDMELDFRTNDGKIQTLLFSFEPVEIQGTHCVISTGVEITQRKHTEQALRQSEKQYHSLVDALDVSLCRWLPDTTLTYFNEKYKTIFGVQDGAVGQKWIDFLPEETRNSTAAFYENVTKDPHTVTYEHPVTVEDGSVRHYQWTDTPILDEYGNILEFQSVGVDVTERKNAEGALRESGARLMGFLNAAPDAMVIVNTEGKIIVMNAQAESMFGYSQGELVGADVEMLMPGTMRNQHIKNRAKFMEQPRAITADSTDNMHALRKDGTEFPIEISLSHHKMATGEAVVLCAIRNVTERKLAEIALIASEKKLQSLVDSQSHFVIRVNLEGKYSYWNKQFEKEFGWLYPQGMQNSYSLTAICEHHRQRVNEVVNKCIAEPGRVFSVEIDKPAQDGGVRNTLWEFMCLTDEHDQPTEIQCMGIEITARKQAEEARRESDERYHLLFEMMTQGVVFQNNEGRVIHANPAAERILGLKVDEMRGDIVNSSNWPLIYEDGSAVTSEDHPAMLALKTGQPVFNVVMGIFNPIRQSYLWLNINTIPRFMKGEASPYQLFTTFEDITERRQTEAQNRKLSQVVEQSPTTVVITGLDGSIEYVNSQFSQVTGYNAQEALGKNPRILKTGHTSPEEYKQLWETVAAGEVWRGEFLNKKKNGELYWESATIAPIFDMNGKITNFLAVKEEITDRKQAEEALRKSQSLLAEAQRVGRIGHLEWTANDQAVICSDELCTLLGLPHDQEHISLETIRQHLSPADRKQMSEMDQKAFGQRADLDYEYRIILDDGRERWLHQVGKMTYDENGRPLRILAIFQDVTERKQAEEKVRESEERYRGLFDDSPVSLWEEDFSAVKAYLDELRAQGITNFHQYFIDHPQDITACAGMVKVLDVNKATVNLFGAAKKEDLLNNLAENLNDDVIEGFADELVNIAEGKTRFEWEGNNRRVDGSLIEVRLGWSAAPGHEEDLSKVLISLTDITKRKQAEEALRVSEERFATIFHSNPTAIAVARQSDNTLIAVNGAWEDLTGWSKEEALGKTPLELNTWVNMFERERLKELVTEYGAAHGFEMQMRHHSGSIRNLLMSAEIVTLQGQPCMLSMAQNITEHKRAEQNLREREELLSVMGRAAHIGGWDLNTVTGEGHWTEEVALIHDLDPDAQPNRDMGISFYCGESQAKIAAAVQEAIEHATSYDLELELISAKGAHKWVRTIGHPVVENGQVVRLRGSFQDITDRKQTEEKLRASEAKFKAVFDNAPVGISLLDPERNSLESNEMLGHFVHLSKEGLASGAYRNRKYIREDGSEIPTSELASTRAIVEQKIVRDVVNGIVLENGEIVWTQVSAAPLGLPDPRIVVITQDITERKLAEKALKESEERFSTTFFSNPVAQLILTQENNEILAVNDACCRLSQYARNELVGFAATKFRLWEDPAERLHIIESLLRTQRLLPHETTLRLKSGAMQTVIIAVEPINWKGLPCFIASFFDITERKLAEEKIIETERRYRALIENAPDGIVLISAEGKFKYTSPSVARIFGYGQEDISQKEPVSMTHPDDLPAVLAELTAVIEDPGRIPTLQYRFLHKDGNWRWIESTFSNLLAVPGVEAIIINFRDIHERKLAEEDLKKSQELLKEAQRIGRIGHMEWSGRDTTLICSDELYNILGLPQRTLVTQEVIGHLMSPEERGRLQQLDQQAIRQHSDMNYEYRIQIKDGSERWLHQMGKISYGENGAPSRMMAIVQDVTEQKQAEETLRESRSRLEMALKGANAAMWDWNVQTGETVFSERWAEMLGYTLQELEPISIQTWVDLCHPEDLQISNDLLEKHFAGGSDFYECEARMKHKNGQWIWVIDRGKVMEWDADGKPVRMFGTHLDITERKKSEEQRRQQMEDMAFVNALNQTANQGGTMEQIVEILRAESARIFHCMDVGVYLLSPDSQSIILQHGSLSEPLKSRIEKFLGYPIPKLEVPIRPGGFFERIISSEQGMITSDPQALQDWMAEFAETPFLPKSARPAVKALIPQIYKLLNIRSVITIPLKSENRILGALEISGKNLLSKQDLERLQNVRASLTEIIRRKQVEQNLMESEEKYRGLMESLDNAVSTVDINGRFLYMNDMGAEHLGGSPQGLIGRTIQELFPEPMASRQMAAIQAVFKTNREAVFETTSTGKDGLRWYRFALQPLHDGAGRVVQVLINATDIHELKTAQQDLQELNHTLEEKVVQRTAEVRDLYDNAPTGYHSLDHEGRFVMVNQTELNWLGYTHDEILGHPAYEFMNESSQAILRSFFPELIKNGWVNDLELEFIRKDGSLLPVLLNSTALYNETGNFVMSRTTIFDITERKQAERDLRESEEQNRLLFEESPVPITLLSRTGSILRVNRAFEQLTGFKRSEMYGKTALEMGLIDAQMGDHIKGLIRAALSENSATIEHPLVSADGKTRTMESRIYLLKINQVGHILITTNDISVYKQAEDALRIANAEMERALRLKDEFLANMSHELRTPLNAILGISESLSEQVIGPLNEKQQKYILTILESGQHLLTLINDILDLAKINAGKVELEMGKIQISAVVQASLRMVRELASKKEQDISFTIDPKVTLVWADERRLKQMLVNLLSNAVKFTPSGGRIGLDVSGDEQNRILDLSVWDTGIGISQTDIQHLFQPFVQLDSGLTRGSQGTGLGLVLVNQMARLHGGGIRVESTPDRGSRFTISIPWISAAKTGMLVEPISRVGQASLQENQKTHPRILLVEDTEAITMLLRDYMERAGYRVFTARNGYDGIAQAANTQPQLILMDVMMPDMDGFETARQLRSLPGFEKIPIIALTALAMPGDRERCFEAGMNDYLSKPVKLQELVSMIQKHLTPAKKENS